MIVVTGGGSGIGRALAHELARKGERVLIIGRREEALQETAQHFATIESLVADVSLDAGRERVITRLQAEDSLKALVHNAGTIEPIALLSDLSLQEWRQTMKTNVEAPLVLTQALLPHRHALRILHVGSGAAYFPTKGWGAYCASKAALSMLTRIWQEEYPEQPIASVMPGVIDTDMQTLIRHASAMDSEKHAFFMDLKTRQLLLDSASVAAFMSWLLLEVSAEEYRAQEWDIYDKRHHSRWLKPPHRVVHWEDE